MTDHSTQDKENRDLHHEQIQKIGKNIDERFRHIREGWDAWMRITTFYGFTNFVASTGLIYMMSKDKQTQFMENMNRILEKPFIPTRGTPIEVHTRTTEGYHHTTHQHKHVDPPLAESKPVESEKKENV